MNRLKVVSCTVVVTVLGSSSVFAAGFEKSMVWSGKAVGQGGAVVGSVKGAESIYFNPAGLATVPGGAGEVSLNFSPTFSKFKGAAPFANSGALEGKSGFSPVFGATAAYQLMPKLGVGFGAYVSGGTKSKFENVGYTNLNANFNDTQATVDTNLSVTELALGGAYEIMPGLKFGAAWRALMVNADFATVNYVQTGVAATSALLNIFVDDLKQTRWNGFKLGLQYASEDDSWGVGANYRSNVSFNAKGKSRGTLESQAGGTTSNLTGGDATIGNAFPEQYVLGGFYRVNPALRLATEYSFAHYSRNGQLNLGGAVTTASGSTVAFRNIVQAWKNQHVARVGGEYQINETWVGRAGYAWTSQVTGDSYARNTFSSPGAGHAITVGGGWKCLENLDLDGAFEYSFASGTGTNVGASVGAGIAKEVSTPTKFSTRAYAFHLGGTYRF